MKRLIPFFAILAAAIVCICLVLFIRESPPDPTQSTAPPTTQMPTLPTVPTESQTQPTETEPAPTETEPAPTETEPLPTETEPVILYTNPLTGEVLPALCENRPYAVVFNNIQAAMPQYGISNADILCEVLAEGGITRCLGIFHDISDTEAFGSIRSARPYFIQLAQGFDAILVHAGASEEGNTYLKNSGWNNIDGVLGTNASKYFYRDKDRLNAGYSLEHTLFIKSTGIQTYAEKLGYATTRPGGVDFGWQFGGSSALAGEAAGSITVYFGSGARSKSTSLVYDADDSLYYASQHGAAHIDGATGQQLSYRNVLVLKTGVKNQGDSAGHLTITTTGSGSGYYACDGRLISIKWSRKSVTDPFIFTTEDGAPIVLGVGKTYLAIVPTNALFKNS